MDASPVIATVDPLGDDSRGARVLQNEDQFLRAAEARRSDRYTCGTWAEKLKTCDACALNYRLPRYPNISGDLRLCPSLQCQRGPPGPLKMAQKRGSFILTSILMPGLSTHYPHIIHMLPVLYEAVARVHSTLPARAHAPVPDAPHTSGCSNGTAMQLVATPMGNC